MDIWCGVGGIAEIDVLEDCSGSCRPCGTTALQYGIKSCFCPISGSHVFPIRIDSGRYGKPSWVNRNRKPLSAVCGSTSQSLQGGN